MAWKDVSIMESRTQFVLMARAQVKFFNELCAEFGISRKTGYKWFNRFKAEGLAGVREKSRRATHCPHKTPPVVEAAILKKRRKHPTWGPKKLQELLDESQAPSISTIGEILKRHGVALKKRRKRGVFRLEPQELTIPEAPNDVWTVDFKGWFRTRDGARCDPLTVTDLATRYILALRILPNATQKYTKAAFRKLFKRYGLPLVIRVDNGSPFATTGIGKLSELSVWWMELGIRVELTRPGCPQDNGSHERMHGTLKAELTKPASANPRAQQLRMNRWRKEYNEDRPHEAIGMQRPAQRYQPSPRRYCGKIKPMIYPDAFEIVKTDTAGFISWKGNRIYLGETLSRKRLGFKPLDNGNMEVYFGVRVLGEITPQTRERLRPTASAVRAFAGKNSNPSVTHGPG